MKSRDKRIVNDALLQIYRGTFAERDIDWLLVLLRDHSRNYPLLREVAHFTAHPDVRTRGDSKDLAELYYLTILFNENYTKDKRLNLNLPFPKWVKQLLLIKVKFEFGPEQEAKYGIAKGRLASFIKKRLRQSSDQKMMVCTGNAFPQPVFAAVDYLLSIVQMRTLGSVESVVVSMASALKDVGFDISDDEYLAQSDRIVLMILTALHQTPLKLFDGQSGELKVTIDPFDDKNRLGLSVLWPFVAADGWATGITVMLTTSLVATDWCAPELLVGKMKENTSDLMDCDLKIGDDGMLCRGSEQI